MCAEAQSGERPGRPARAANVVLVGLSGSGKSTVGRLLARRLGWRFVDTDREIERREGKIVQAIFRDAGEPAFRGIEAGVIREVCSKTHQVIATGGGAVVDASNRAQLLSGNLVIWLETAPSTLAKRLAHTVNHEPRPLLAGDDLATTLATLEQSRAPHYRCAHRTVRTDERTPREVADAIAQLVRER